MTYKFRLPLLICFSALLVGCNALNWRTEGERARVYAGVRVDCEGLAKARSTGMYAPFIFTYSAIDMPFSLVVDTLYIPSDIVAIHQENRRDSMPARTNELNKSASSASSGTAPAPTTASVVTNK